MSGAARVIAVVDNPARHELIPSVSFFVIHDDAHRVVLMLIDQWRSARVNETTRIPCGVFPQSVAPEFGVDLVCLEGADRLEAEGPLALGKGIGHHELIVAVHPYLADLGFVYGLGDVLVYLTLDVGIVEKIDVLHDRLHRRRLGGSEHLAVVGTFRFRAEAVQKCVKRVARADLLDPIDRWGDESFDVVFGKGERLDVLVIGEHPLVVHFAVVACDAPVDVAGIRISEVLIPGVVVFGRLELGFREDDVDIVDRIFFAPAVFDRRYPMLVGVSLEVECREVSLDEAGAGNE